MKPEYPSPLSTRLLFPSFVSLFIFPRKKFLFSSISLVPFSPPPDDYHRRRLYIILSFHLPIRFCHFNFSICNLFCSPPLTHNSAPRHRQASLTLLALPSCRHFIFPIHVLSNGYRNLFASFRSHLCCSSPLSLCV